MPTYEYRCDKGHTFERVQKMTDKALSKCPVCGSRASRVISGGQGVIFKGSGFYITDYGKDGKGARKDPDATGTEAKVETKPEGKTKPNGDASKADVKPAEKPASGSKPGKPDAT